MIQSSGLAGGRGQAGVTCSHRHGIKCPLTGSRCCPAVHPQFRPALLRGLCSDPHQLRPQINFWVSVSSSAAQARIKMEELARKTWRGGSSQGPSLLLGKAMAFELDLGWTQLLTPILLGQVQRMWLLAFSLSPGRTTRKGTGFVLRSNSMMSFRQLEEGSVSG